MIGDTVRVDFWFDPSCPYTWLTSRWMLEVERVRQVTVRWRVMSLSVLNEGRDDDPEGDPEGFLWRPARVCAAVQLRYGHDALGRFFTALGVRLHHHGRWDDVAGALSETGLPRGLAAVAESTAFDDALRASHDEGIALVGDHFGTPILAVTHGDVRDSDVTDGGGDRAAFFGPVISRVPRGEQAGRLWDGTLLVAATPGFHELKGTAHEPPELAAPRDPQAG